MRYLAQVKIWQVCPPSPETLRSPCSQIPVSFSVWSDVALDLFTTDLHHLSHSRQTLVEHLHKGKLIRVHVGFTFLGCRCFSFALGRWRFWGEQRQLVSSHLSCDADIFDDWLYNWVLACVVTCLFRGWFPLLSYSCRLWHNEEWESWLVGWIICFLCEILAACWFLVNLRTFNTVWANDVLPFFAAAAVLLFSFTAGSGI